ncbi:MAG: methylated-DNA--[protein]-cysteine S-methyltransferase [Gammaproteobacteria bacterium]|nr:methylated-DNA--[protein]-cysteine S-methyltransferase [Gammaproteobacteria bacterium]
MQLLNTDEFVSPIGTMVIFSDENALCHLDFKDCQDRISRLLTRRYQTFQLAKKANVLNMRDRLAEYFAGNWTAFENLPLETGGTEFQQKVWRQLRKIPRGKTISYAELANAIGQPSAVRAVASANARNPLSIIIPCHRVIGSDGSLTGYAGGVPRKDWLLRHEQALQ